MQDCINSITNALELPPSCTEPSISVFGKKQEPLICSCVVVINDDVGELKT